MPKGVILHSDRGSQYRSTAYQSLVLKHQLVCSMSAKGTCYDNACAESFFHTMKVEAIHGERIAIREEMRTPCSNILKLIATVFTAIVRMAASVPWRLKLSKQLNRMSTQHGQDRISNNYLDLPKDKEISHEKMYKTSW